MFRSFTSSSSLGITSVPESIVYLDKGVVFIGSYFGDSQLIHLRSDIDPDTKCYFDVYEEYPNLGPIADMIFVENEGQNQLITCSGYSRDGSLRIIRNGIGIQEIATIGQEHMNGMRVLVIRVRFEFCGYLYFAF